MTQRKTGIQETLKSGALAVGLFLGVFFVAEIQSARADTIGDAFSPEIHSAEETPLTIRELQEIPPGRDIKAEIGLPLDIRKEAQKEAALSLGARGGLASRTFEINRSLRQYSGYMDKVFDFRQLLISAPSGLLIEPPIITENIDAVKIDVKGLKAAVSDRIYDISRNARIVTAARNWRLYMDRTWGELELPPDILRPKNDEEREEWRKNVAIGWKQGVDQADQTFETDLSRLVSDFNGMIRYRQLLARGMVSTPFTLQTDRGVTGGGLDKNGNAKTLRVGDRAVQITGVPELVPGAEQWLPANR